jgi:four helix bundle protein
MRRAVVSIISNIAEGFERDGNNEFIQFLSHAKGSAGEVMSQLYVAYEQHYIDEATFRRVRSMALQIIRMLGSLMAYLRASSYKGKKFVRA